MNTDEVARCYRQSPLSYYTLSFSQVRSLIKTLKEDGRNRRARLTDQICDGAGLAFSTVPAAHCVSNVDHVVGIYFGDGIEVFVVADGSFRLNWRWNWSSSSSWRRRSETRWQSEYVLFLR